MHTQSSGLIAVAVAIVVAGLIVAFSPLLWTDKIINDRLTPAGMTQPLPAGCSVQTQALGTGGGAIVVAHCPFWVHVP